MARSHDLTVAVCLPLPSRTQRLCSNASFKAQIDLPQLLPCRDGTTPTQPITNLKDFCTLYALYSVFMLMFPTEKAREVAKTVGPIENLM